MLPTTELWADSQELRWGKLNVRVLAPTHQTLHNIIHTEVQDLNHAVGGLSLRKLVSLARIVRFHGEAIDWDFIEARAQAHDLVHEVHDLLWLAHRLLGLSGPAFRGRMRPRLHEARVLVGFGLGWPPEVQRNLRGALVRGYLDSLYGHDSRTGWLAIARMRHVWRLATTDSHRAAQAAFKRKE